MGERVTIEVIDGVEGCCIAINDYRVAGPKPWGGGQVIMSWTTEVDMIQRALMTPEGRRTYDEMKRVVKEKPNAS